MNFFSSLIGEPVPTLTVMELQEKLQNGKQPFLLDVRQPEEFHLSHISGAKLIPLGELGQRIEEMPLDREIVCICATGNRSMSAVLILKKAGYTARSVKNGMTAWQMANLPIKKGV